jgi:lipid A 3-O-deacylase
MFRKKSAITCFLLSAAASCLFLSNAATAQDGSSTPLQISSSAGASAPVQASGTASTVLKPDAMKVLATDPWEYGPFFNGGFGTGDRNTDTILSVGLHVGKVVTDPHLSGLFRGQFEYAGDLMPWWQGRTPRFLRANCYGVPGHVDCTPLYPTGGNYNGVSVTPIILRWNFVGNGRQTKIVPFVQGAGGLIWTNHKFPPVGPYQTPGHQGTSVFNFTPQFGIGVHYFVKPHQSLTVQANAVHISSASLGDSNPGVNASVQFTVGYTWWK